MYVNHLQLTTRLFSKFLQNNLTLAIKKSICFSYSRSRNYVKLFKNSLIFHNFDGWVELGSNSERDINNDQFLVYKRAVDLAAFLLHVKIWNKLKKKKDSKIKIGGWFLIPTTCQKNNMASHRKLLLHYQNETIALWYTFCIPKILTFAIFLKMSKKIHRHCEFSRFFTRLYSDNGVGDHLSNS